MHLPVVRLRLKGSLVRPPDTVVGGRVLARFFYFLSLFVFRQLPPELAERNSTKTVHMLEG